MILNKCVWVKWNTALEWILCFVCRQQVECRSVVNQLIVLQWLQHPFIESESEPALEQHEHRSFQLAHHKILRTVFAVDCPWRWACVCVCASVRAVHIIRVWMRLCAVSVQFERHCAGCYQHIHSCVDVVQMPDVMCCYFSCFFMICRDFYRKKCATSLSR